MQKRNLYQTAKKYVELIEKTEEADERGRLFMHERCVNVHWQWIDLLEREGIGFRDRDHATELAFKVVRGNL